MGLLITNVEISKNCDSCNISEILTPHGDLIDRDDYIAILDRMIQDPTSSEVIQCVAETVRETLLEMPVVVPAEG